MSPEVALLAIALRSGDRLQLGVELPSPERCLGVEPDPEETWHWVVVKISMSARRVWP